MSDKWAAFTWVSGFIALLLAILMVSSCVRDQNLKAQTVAQQCLQSGKHYLDTDKTYGACI